MATLGVTNRGRACKIVRASYRQYRGAMISDLARLTLPPEASAEEVATRVAHLEVYFDSLDFVLNRSIGDLTGTDDVYTRELSIDEDVRQARDETKAPVYEILSYARQTNRLGAGEDFLRKWALNEAVPEEPKSLLDYAEAVSEAVPRADAPEPKKEHLPVAMVSGEELLAKLVPAKEAFGGAYDTYLAEQRKTEDAMLKRRRLIDGHDGLFVRVVRIFEDNYRLVDLDEEAERIRPSRRRPGLLAQDENQDAGKDDDVVDDAADADSDSEPDSTTPAA